MRTFTPLTDFFSAELNSHYCDGLSYTVRPVDTVLAQLVPRWIKTGQVRLGLPTQHSPGKANVRGTGDVT